MTEEEKDLMTMALDALVDWNHSFNPGEEADKDLIKAIEKYLENDDLTQRTWVGLTPYEIQEIHLKESHWGNFACLIEAKLRSKNGY